MTAFVKRINTLALYKNIAYTTPLSGEGSSATEIAKLSPEELYAEYDPAGVAFKPVIRIPKMLLVKKVLFNYNLSDEGRFTC